MNLTWSFSVKCMYVWVACIDDIDVCWWCSPSIYVKIHLTGMLRWRTEHTHTHTHFCWPAAINEEAKQMLQFSFSPVGFNNETQDSFRGNICYTAVGFSLCEIIWTSRSTNVSCCLQWYSFYTFSWKHVNVPCNTFKVALLHIKVTLNKINWHHTVWWVQHLRALM